MTQALPTNTSATEAVPALAEGYRAFSARRVVILLVLAALLAVSLLWDVATGPAMLSLGDVLGGMLFPDALTRAESVIIWDVRLPYAVMALLVGATLGLAGAEMQTVLNNPLASPFTLGISAAATFGASLAIVLGVSASGIAGDVAVPVFAFVFAMAATGLIIVFSRAYGTTIDMVVLFGIAMLFAMQALVSLIQYVADSDTLQQIVFWTMGSLGRATWSKIGIVGAVLVVCASISAATVWHLTTLRAGEEQARALGIQVERLRISTLIRASLLTAVAVAFVGTVGFVGLVGPHMARLMLGEDHRFFLPGAALASALMLSLASIASKTIVPGIILPVGIVTALAGIPLFIALIALQRRFQ